MSGSAVKCVTTPCVSSCPDAKVVIHPPPLVLTLPGLILNTSPGQCLVETKTSCLTNGSELCGDGCSTAVVTKSSGPRALCGDTPCCTTTTPDSQLVIQPPPVCITIPGAVLTSYPNECLIETSSPCVPSGTAPRALLRSKSISDSTLASNPMARSTSVPCELNTASCIPEGATPCVTQGPSSKVVIYPPPIDIIIPGPVLEVAADQCTVEVYNPCSSTDAITSGEECKAITSGEPCEVKTLATRAKTSTEVFGVIATSPCISQGPEMKITIQPPPFEVDLPGPILKVFPEACKVETLSPCAPEPQALCSSSSETAPSTALSARSPSLSYLKRPLPDIRRPARPWAEMYSRSMTPRSIMASRIPKYRNNFSSASTGYLTRR